MRTALFALSVRKGPEWTLRAIDDWIKYKTLFYSVESRSRHGEKRALWYSYALLLAFAHPRPRVVRERCAERLDHLIQLGRLKVPRLKGARGPECRHRGGWDSTPRVWVQGGDAGAVECARPRVEPSWPVSDDVVL